MKAIAINGSPRKGGNTEILLRKVMEPLTEAGWDTEFIQLGGQPIHGCRACYDCFKKKNSRCGQKGEEVFDLCLEKMILADAIVDVSETGSSLRANNLRVLHVVLESTPRFIANRDSLTDAWKKAKIDNILMMLLGAINAATRVYLSMNVPSDRQDAIKALLPASATPTVAPLDGSNWVDLSIVVEEKLVRDLIPRLYQAGARSILELPINKIVA